MRQKEKQGKQTKKALFRGNTQKHETRQKYIVSQKPDKSNDMKIRLLLLLLFVLENVLSFIQEGFISSCIFQDSCWVV